jgi:hypothetical protein
MDKWKEDFLLEIEQSHQALTGVSSATTYSNDEYKIIGLAFYNHNNENKIDNDIGYFCFD